MTTDNTRAPLVPDDELLALPTAAPPVVAPKRRGRPLKVKTAPRTPDDRLRTPGGQFLKGTIGNPAGLPNLKGVEVKVISPAMLPKIRAMAAEGMTEATIARDICGMSTVTWTQRKKDHPEVVDAVAAGRDDMRNALVASLLKTAKAGNFVPAFFLLKTMHGFREGDTQQEMRPTINITLRGSLSPEQYRIARGMTIEANAEPETDTAPVEST